MHFKDVRCQFHVNAVLRTENMLHDTTKHPLNAFILSAIAVKNAVSNRLPEGLCGLLIIKNDGCTSSIFVKTVSRLNVT